MLRKLDSDRGANARSGQRRLKVGIELADRTLVTIRGERCGTRAGLVFRAVMVGVAAMVL